MLRNLSIRDYVIVERLDLDFGAGFTVLTGETGAGKSILIDALALLLGERSDTLVIRQGAERTELTAEFDTGDAPAVAGWLVDNGLEAEDHSCIVRRVIDNSGRSRAFLNGRAVTLAQLRELGAFLVDIHGQHEHQSLLRSGAQRDLLDAYAGLTDDTREVGAAWREWQRRREARIALETNAATYAAEKERLEWTARELEALDFGLEDWQQLLVEHARLAHAA
ncbi:MAG TPA: AAA family ATPase, partial [Burkholderiales bacterium]|nr:AAA family ATPase [Burkholderiales bacterium]